MTEDEIEKHLDTFEKLTNQYMEEGKYLLDKAILGELSEEQGQRFSDLNSKFGIFIIQYCENKGLTQDQINYEFLFTLKTFQDGIKNS